MKKRIAILGSTGSIGKQTTEVILNNPDTFEVEVLTAQTNYSLLISQAIKLRPNVVVIGETDHFQTVRDSLYKYDIKVYAGEDAITQIVQMDNIDIVVLGIVGIAAIKPLLAALKSKKRIALANKESIVVAGDIIKKTALENGGQIIPVDSEHSAIFQSLMGEGNNPISKITLTASGGPFLNSDNALLENASISEALKHPNWEMGRKVTIDSSTMMNKGLEAIEAHWLFDLQPDNIEVLVHPQSIIHSMVFFKDGTVKTLMSNADMRIPIQFALSYPDRLTTSFSELDLVKISELNFFKPDLKKFRNLALAFEALKTGGNMPCILNAANDMAVEAFLENHIGFLRIPEIVEETMYSVSLINKPSLEEYFQTDSIARSKACEIINKRK